jgi:hypothetical protein
MPAPPESARHPAEQQTKPGPGGVQWTRGCGRHWAELTYRTSMALAERLGTQPAEFPGDHGGFIGQPAGFADVVRKVLAG